jgi:hypothetical protein
MSALIGTFAQPVAASAGNVMMELAQLPTVSLAVLRDNADLQTRLDRKYILQPSLVADLIRTRADRLCVLDMGGAQAFAYESVYFDTPSLDSYRSSAFGRRRRFKVRTRTYLDSKGCVLELKSVGARGETVKDRLEYNLADRHRLNDIGAAYLESRCLSMDVIQRLAPTLTTSYHRSTLLDTDGARYTIDAGLICTGMDGAEASVGDGVFLETKAPGAATPLDRMLWSRGHRPVSVSKYCSGLAALTPGLPANKWNRTLRSHYGWQPTASRIGERLR